MAKSKLDQSLKNGALLEKMAYDADIAEPSQNDNDAQMFAKFGEMFSAPGDRPRGIWRNLGAGLAEGAAHGARSKGIEEKKGKNEKFQKVVEYLRAVNNSAIEQNQWHEKRAMEMENIKPYAIAGLEVSYSGMDYAIGNERMRNLVDQAKLNNPNIKGDYVGYVPNSPIVNLRDESGNITALSLSTLAGEDTVKRVQGNYIDLQTRKAAQQKEDREDKYAPEKYSVQREKLDETRRRNDQTAIKSDMKLAETLGKKIDASREFLTIAPKMEKIVNDHPDIFQSAIDAVWREGKEPGYISNMTKDVQNKWNPEKVAALTSMVKYINKMTLDVANGFARPNMFIEKIGSRAVPNLDMNPQGFLNVLGEMVEENKTSVRNNLERFSLLESDANTGISGQYRESTADVMGEGALGGGDPFSGWERVQ